jgi:hypothetical protein
MQIMLVLLFLETTQFILISNFQIYPQWPFPRRDQHILMLTNSPAKTLPITSMSFLLGHDYLNCTNVTELLSMVSKFEVIQSPL